MKKILLLACSLSLYFGYSQQRRVSDSKATTFESEIEKARVKSPNGVVRCATFENLTEQQLRKKAISDEEFEKWIAPKIQEIREMRSIGKLPAVIKIPVVIHIIHNGDAVGAGENISNAQALSQITVFNQDFRRQTGTPGFGAGVDTSIEFCLAQVDPNGNATNGIDRRQLTSASYTSRAAVEAAKASTIWDPTKYLNMWVMRFGGSMANILGYAQFPSGSGLAGMPSEDCIAGEASTDGVVCNFNTWGSRTLAPTGTYGGTQYDKGRTMTHEVGHMLGLRHIWGDGGCEVDDFCADTPNCENDYYAGAGTGGCIAPTQCGNVRQIENYMDYSDDGCMNMFTQNQKDRMLAVLMNSPRRDDLLVSTVCSAPQASIQFKRTACETRLFNSEVVEGSACSYTEYTVPLNINKAPTANAVVTFAIDGTSVANASDFTIMTPTVTFNSGVTTDRNLVLRVLNDGIVEPNEDIVITFTVNANGGDAFANPEGNKLKMTIINDDATPSIVNNAFVENFDPVTNALSIYDADGDGENWSVLNEAAFGTTVGFSGNFAISRSWDGTALMPDNYLVSSAITIPSGATNISLSFTAGTIEAAPFQFEHFAVYLGTGSAPAAISAQTPVHEETLANAQSFHTVTLNNLNAYAGQTVYLAFRHFDTSDMNTLIIDDINLNYQLQVQTAVNNATRYQANIIGTGLAHTRDASSGRVMADITSNTDFNYGCTSVSVSRDQATAGAAAVNYGSNTANNLKVMAKTVTVTPATNNPTGAATMKFYFSEAEIAAWETATGNLRSALRVIKQGDTSVLGTTLGTFGSNTTLTANVANGIGGVYYFGVQNTLGVNYFEFDNFALYPNPNKGDFTVMFTSSTGSDIKVVAHDLRGRQVYENSFTNTGAINQSVSLNNVESGIYLVSIIDGGKKTVRRVVIE